MSSLRVFLSFFSVHQLWQSTAGIDPRSLRGSSTGLFQGSCFPEYHKDFREPTSTSPYVPNQVTTIARHFGFRGPYMHIDTACGSAACALNEAYQAIRKGLCDQAIVTGANSVFQPVFSYEMLDLKMISRDGKSKCMDAGANGYARAEAVAVIFLQRSRAAKRIYARILNCRTNADGWKAEGVTFPGQAGQAKLLRQTYEEIGIDPTSFPYIEAHTTGTAAGDPVELNAIHDVLCGTGRKDPLLVGCIKSNIGHSEGASGLCALIKSLFVLQEKRIPPNLHLKNHNLNINGLVDGSMTPVNQVTKFTGHTIPVNCFGFGGANVHMVIQAYERPVSFRVTDKYPRLVNVCGRTAESCDYIMDHLLEQKSSLTQEFLSLIDNFSQSAYTDFPYRSYILMTSHRAQIIRSAPVPVSTGKKVCLYFPDGAEEDVGLAFSLLSIPMIAASIKSLEDSLKNIGVDLIQSMRRIERTRKETIAINLAIQISLIDLLNGLGIEVDELAGKSVGEFACGYADSIISKEQVILSSFCTAAFYYSEKNLKTSLDKLLIVKAKRSDKWISDGPLIISGKYFADHIQSPRHGQKLLSQEDDAIHIEVGTWGLRRIGSKTSDACLETIQLIGELYTSGVHVQISNLYPEVVYPLPTSVPSLSPLIKWDHRRTWPLDSRKIELNKNTAVLSKIIPFTFDKQNPEDAFLFDHKIDGRILFPATGYLAMAWFALSKIHQKSIHEVPVKFTDVLIERATVLTSSKSVLFHVRMDDETGSFAVKDGDAVVVSGKMELIPEFNHYVQPDAKLDSKSCVQLDMCDVYKEFRVRGYDYDAFFQGLHSARCDGKEGKLIWRDVAPKSAIDALNVQSEDSRNLLWLRSWICFADSLIQLTLLNSDSTGRALLVPTKLESLICSPASFLKGLSYGEEFQDSLTLNTAKLLPCRYSKFEDVIESSGLVLKGLKVTLLKRNQQMVRMKSYSFMPFNEDDTFLDSKEDRQSVIEYHDTCVKLARKINQSNFILDTKIFQDVKESRHALLNILSAKINHRDLPDVDLSKDLILGMQESDDLYQDRLIKPFFDLATYNLISRSSDTTFTVLDVTSTGYTLENKLRFLMEESLFSDQTSLSYSLLDLNQYDAVSTVIPTSDFVIYRCFDQHFISEDFIRSLYASLKDGGFLLVLSNQLDHLNPEIDQVLQKLNLSRPLFAKTDQLEFFACRAGFFRIGEKRLMKGVLPIVATMMRKQSEILEPAKQIVIDIGINDYESWLDQLKDLMKREEQVPGQRIWLTVKHTGTAAKSNKRITGLIGFVKSLRLEPGGDRIRCVIDWTSRLNLSFFDARNLHLLRKDLVYNVFHHEAQGWGTYEHAFFSNDLYDEDVQMIQSVYLKCLKPGDLSSLTWMETGIEQRPNDNIIHVSHAALNFKDIMYASGRLAIDSVGGIDPAVAQDSLLGIEFAGINNDGNRVMGVLPYKALATKVAIDDNSFLLPVPRDWSLEEASTVPVVYSTAFYGLVVRGKLRQGESVLIHSGAGGVGMAAINICASLKCRIFTTVGTKEKADFLIREFSHLKPENIFNSRDCTFEEDVMKATDGVGVDLVLNSLPGDKLQASLRCVAESGRFIEIGKVDLLMDKSLYAWQMSGNRSMHGVYPESFFRFNDRKEHYFPDRMQNERMQLRDLIIKGMRDGTVRPLNRTIFAMNKVEEAFRFMSSGKHVGKVVIKVASSTSSLRPEQVMRVTYFDPRKSYLVIGGLGGFGLEFLMWMCEKGARKIVVNSRRGLRDPYHKYSVQRMRDDGVELLISQADSTSEKGIQSLIASAEKMGLLGGVFNTAAVFDDMLFTDQTDHTFDSVCSPKVKPTMILDHLTRTLCPDLDYFVAFSSISAGRGNPGQTSYNFANSIIDSICEERRKDGLPGLSIQWGVIGDVGYVAEKSNSNNTIILGLTAQRMHSCLSSLDSFMQCKESIVTCYVKAEKSSANEIGSSTDVLKVVSRILGLRDIQSLDPNMTLSNLGIDSLIAVEIQQILERVQGSSVPLKQVKELKISEFILMTSKRSSSAPTAAAAVDEHKQEMTAGG